MLHPKPKSPSSPDGGGAAPLSARGHSVPPPSASSPSAAPLSARDAASARRPAPGPEPASVREPRSSGAVRRILVVDDNPAVHEDFRKILCPAEPNHALAALEDKLFADAGARPEPDLPFRVDTALQGRDAHALVVRALRMHEPYALAFVDMRMPPGWDGIETIQHIRKDDPAIELVICSAYSEYSWMEVKGRLGLPTLQFLPKPFHSRDVLALAWSLSTRWVQRHADLAPG